MTRFGLRVDALPYAVVVPNSTWLSAVSSVFQAIVTWSGCMSVTWMLEKTAGVVRGGVVVKLKPPCWARLPDESRLRSSQK